MAFKGFKAAWGEEDPEEQAFAGESSDYGAVSEGARLENIIERGADEISQQIAPSAAVFDESFFRLDDTY